MKSIVVRLLVNLFAILFLSNVVIYFISTNGVSTAMNKEINSSLQKSVHSIANAVEDFNELQWKGLETLALNPTITNPNADLLEKTYITFATMKGDQKYLDVCITDTNGNAYINGGERIISFAERDYVQEALKGNRFVGHPFKNKVTGLMSIFYSLPVYDDQHRIINAIFCIVDGYSLCDIIDDNKVSDTRTGYVINRANGLTAAASDRAYLDDGHSFLQQAQTQEANGEASGYVALINQLLRGGDGTGSFKRGKDTFNIIYEEVENTPWTVYTGIPASEMKDGINAIQSRLLLTFALSTLVVVFIIYFSIGVALKPLKTVKDAIEGIATGNADLTNRLTLKRNDEIGGVVKGFNMFLEKLHNIVKGVFISEDELNNAGGQLDIITKTNNASVTRIIEDLNVVNSKIESQNQSVSQTIASVDEITANISSLEHMIESQSQGVSQASAAVEQMIGNILSVNKSVESMASSFQSLAENAKTGINLQSDVNERISQIESQSEMLQEANSAISAIAEQTNLLAMNAAIEAAHAGDAGKGFSVVADEIRKLSETSTAQSKTIGDELNKIKSSIEAVVSASSQSNEAFLNVTSKITETDQLVRQIKAAMEEQQTGSQQISDALHTMNDSTVEVRTASAEMSEGNKAILVEVDNLRNVTGDMNESISNITKVVSDIKSNGDSLNNVSRDLNAAINKIGHEINQFKV